MIATVVVVWTGNVKEAYLREGIASANERAESAREHAAQLELRVAEAKKLAAPRNIRGQDKDHVKAALESFRGTPYDLSFPPIADHSPEPSLLEPGSMLIDHLMVILSNLCGWELHSIEGGVTKVPLPKSERLLTFDTGVAADHFEVPAPAADRPAAGFQCRHCSRNHCHQRFLRCSMLVTHGRSPAALADRHT